MNVVLVGFDQRDIEYGSSSRAGLPGRYEPVVRSRLRYGQVEKLGISYSYDYRLTFADHRYENAFFTKLKRLGRKAPLTNAQELYNEQPNKAAEVTNNTEIPAPAVERWLADHPPARVDTRRNTVFLINWYGRSDFRFHVYTKTDEPDPDTDYNFGTQRASRKLTAWGGTTARDEQTGLGRTRRVWFHDLSAGPEEWAGSWNITDDDLDGGGPDYRIPPIWEYGHYRPQAALSGDLSKLIRYVAIDLLFTTSPLYPAELPTPEPPRADQPRREHLRGLAGRGRIQPLHPSRAWSPVSCGSCCGSTGWTTTIRICRSPARPGGATRSWSITCAAIRTPSPPLANLYLQNTRELARTKDDVGRVDYELPIFAYAVPTEDAPALGYADDNYVDGTQSYVFVFISPGIVDARLRTEHHASSMRSGTTSVSAIRTTATTASRRSTSEPTGDYYFAWLGDFSNSMMSYIDLNWDFSQFDIDNLSRFQTAASIEAANRLTAAALTGPRPDRARPALHAADRFVGQAEREFGRHHYGTAQAYALAAYHLTVRAAERAGVEVTAVEAPVRAAAQAARGAAAAHDGQHLHR